jgi:hypothetical protein
MKTDLELLDYIWHQIKNMDGEDISYEWMEKGDSSTEYIKRSEVLKLINEIHDEENKD